MYLNTLGLKKSEVRYWLENFQESNIPNSIDTKRGYLNNEDEELVLENNVVEYDRENRHKVIKKKKQAIDSMKQFFNILPTLPSYYCRKTSDKLFLQIDIKS